MEMLEAQLHSIHSAYRSSRAKPFVDQSDKDFQQDIEQSLLATLPPHDLVLINKCTYYRQAALKAAREGDLKIADYLFSATEKLLSSEMLSPAGLLMTQSAHEAAVSYLDYRRGEFAIGTARIYRSLAIDEELENTYGSTIHHLHRIRLLLNLVRLKRRQGESMEAFRMSMLVADYLEQKIATLPFPTSWDSSKVEPLPFSPKNFLFEQALSEIVFMVVGQENIPEAWLHDLETHIAETQAAENVAACRLSPRFHRWLQARKALQTKQISSCLEIIEPLILTGPDSAIWLWYGLLMDLALVCQELHFANAHSLFQDITVDMLSWPWPRLPLSWKHIFDVVHTSNPV